MKKLMRIITGLILIALGALVVISSVNQMLEGQIFWNWLSPGLFGLTLIAAGIAVIAGARWREIFENYI